MIKKVILILALVIFIIGCAEKECESDADCLTKDCFTVKCTDTKCVYSPISDCCGNEICEVGEIYPECVVDCPNCDDKNDCTVDEYDYHEQKCVSTIIPNVVCCGNSVCDIGETYEDCTRDCPNCDDENACTEDSYEYHEQKCVNELIIPCCGNGICDEETAESYDTCPSDCKVIKECVMYAEKADVWFGIGKICDDKNDCVAYRNTVYSNQIVYGNQPEVLEYEVKCVAISPYKRIEVLLLSCIDTQDCLEGLFGEEVERYLENVPQVQQEGWKEVMMCRDNLCEATENFLKYLEAT